MGSGASNNYENTKFTVRPNERRVERKKVKDENASVVATKRNNEIERYLVKEQTQEEKTVKVLLLGSGESGKSTFAKQMRILHMDGFCQNDLRNYRRLVHANSALALHQLLQAITKLEIVSEGITYSDMENFRLFAKESNCDCELTAEYGALMKRLWASPAIQEAYSSRTQFHLLDSARYFLNSLDRISAPDYIPTDDDVLRTRAHTMGINEIHFHLRGFHFKMVDVGGQKTERRKWIHCFDNVTAVLFISSLSEYDQVLVEDNSTNRLQDSLALFSFIAGNVYFARVALLLFLNKKDIFQEKIPKAPLKHWLPEYQGPDDDYREARRFILGEFIKCKPMDKQLYSYFTTATDTNNIDVVFSASVDIILSSALGSVGFN